MVRRSDEKGLGAPRGQEMERPRRFQLLRPRLTGDHRRPTEGGFALDRGEGLFPKFRIPCETSRHLRPRQAHSHLLGQAFALAPLGKPRQEQTDARLRDRSPHPVSGAAGHRFDGVIQPVLVHQNVAGAAAVAAGLGQKRPVLFSVGSEGEHDNVGPEIRKVTAALRNALEAADLLPRSLERSP